jgi:Family of unknown function (DUF6288)
VKEMMFVAVLVLLFSCSPVFAAQMDQKTGPDYTKGEKFEAGLRYCELGPIGAIGNVWSPKGSAHPTENTRMIQIRSVAKGSRAAGVLNAGDVILGVISPVVKGTNKPDASFDADARKALSAAITEAEKKENGGKLVLNVWRIATAKSEPVTVVIPVMGAFSATSPCECEKTTAMQKPAPALISIKPYIDVTPNPVGSAGKK